MARILYVATSDLHIKTFHVPYLDWLKSQGHTVDLAVENRGNYKFTSCEQYHYLKFPRKALSWQHIKSFENLRKIITNGNYQLVHCHTPIPSAICRLSARDWRDRGGKLLYTAHGFHFYRGGSLWKWCTYYPVERYLSSFTDGIITINNEDYCHAKEFGSGASIYQIPGIGIAEKFTRTLSEDPIDIKQSFRIGPNDFVITYIAEFIPRKNHRFIVRATGELLKKIPQLKILFVGDGTLLNRVRQMISKSGLEKAIYCLGFRDDIQRIANITDIAVSSSLHEGLGLGLAEQMMCGIPAVASRDKGHAELVDHGVNGFLYDQGNILEFTNFIAAIYDSLEMRQRMSIEANKKAQLFHIRNSLEAMAKIYSQYI